jgi:hypothetical protein
MAKPENVRREALRNHERLKGGEMNMCMHEAIERIDAEFGEGYAKANPGLVGKFMERVHQSYDETDNAIESVANAIGSMDFSGIADAIQNIAAMIDLNTPLKIRVLGDEE